MTRLTTLYIDKESHKFSAAHYTIFSARIVAPMGDNGFSADYNVYKSRLKTLCDELDEYMVLAADSPHQTIEKQGDNYLVRYADEEMLFLCSDTLVLPILNATVEEFSHYLLGKLLEASRGDDLREIELCVASGPGQKGCAIWRAGD